MAEKKRKISTGFSERWRNVTGMSTSKNHAKKPFATKASGNLASETYVTGVYICSHML